MSQTEKNFYGIYKGKRVLVLGHTGFKGAWLSLWLVKMGAQVAGFSESTLPSPSLFEALKLKKHLKHYQADVRDLSALKKVFNSFKPEVVFHLAAQPIVRTAYQDPKATFDINLGGTVNVLECIRHCPSVKAAVIITSDKCYENFNYQRGYTENDRLGGKDPYSASKACAEIAFSAYFRSFFTHRPEIQLATARSGNVIGGGDWATDRIIPDCVRAWSKGQVVRMRSPKATRPWLHVLESLSGYLWLGANLMKNGKDLNGQTFNFAPRYLASHDVQTVVELFLTFWGKGQWCYEANREKKAEAMLLQLSPKKTAQNLQWTSALTFRETVKLTAEWYREYYGDHRDIWGMTSQQIDFYVQKAKERQQVWAG